MYFIYHVTLLCIHTSTWLVSEPGAVRECVREVGWVVLSVWFGFFGFDYHTVFILLYSTSVCEVIIRVENKDFNLHNVLLVKSFLCCTTLVC